MAKCHIARTRQTKKLIQDWVSLGNLLSQQGHIVPWAKPYANDSGAQLHGTILPATEELPKKR